MNQRDTEDALVSQLRARVEAQGFRYLRSKREFKRKKNGNIEAISFAVFNYNPLFRIRFFVSTTYVEVEEFFDRLILEFAKKKKISPILVTPLEKIVDSRNRYEVRTATEIEQVAEEFIGYVEGPILTYFEATKNPLMLDKNLDLHTRPLFDPDIWSVVRRIYYAALGENPRLKNIVEDYKTQVLERCKPDSLNIRIFNTFCAALFKSMENGEFEKLLVCLKAKYA